MSATTLPDPLNMMGAPGSPYTRKMRALLRYRHIRYRMILLGSEEHARRPAPRVALLPTFYFPGHDGEEVAVVDSTPIIRRLEEAVTARSVIPPDPAMAFLDALLEDYGDEWLTKAMFHYRWAFDSDVAKAAAILPLWRRIDVTDAEVAPLGKAFAGHQIARLGVVGSNETTGPVIEESYRRFLRAFDAHLQTHPFLMGRRPGSSDFAVYGQLTQLALFDPTPAAVTLEIAPRVYAWVEILEDASGIDAGDDAWISAGDVPRTLKALLAEVGRTYVPVMIANAEALERGADQVEARVDGARWVQKPFPYQGKCLRALRERNASLAADDRAAVDAALAGTGCERLFAAG